MNSTSGGIFSIGKYRVIGTLGRGAIGVVYKAQDPEIGRIVAVKVLRSIDSANQEQVQSALDQFKLEARSAGNLRHPKIITVFEVSSQGTSPYIVMDYIDGQGLDQILARNGALRVDIAIDILSQIAEGLDYAHDRDVIHRDIKPSNILIDSNGGAFIVDFGVATIGRSTVDPGGPIVGSPGYMSPEQILSRSLDRSSDLFSFAILAYETLTGSRPFDGDNFNAVISQILNSQPRPISSLRPEFPLEMEVVFEKALAKDPQNRYMSGKDFVSALARALGNMKVGADNTKPRSKNQANWNPLGLDGKVKQESSNMPVPVAKNIAKNVSSGINLGDATEMQDDWDIPSHGPNKRPKPAPRRSLDQRPDRTLREEDDLIRDVEKQEDAQRRALMMFASFMLMVAGGLVLWFYVFTPKPVPVPVDVPQKEIVRAPEEKVILPEALAADRYDVPALVLPLASLTDREMLGVIAKGERPIEDILKAITVAQEKKIIGRYEAMVHLINNDAYIVRIEALKVIGQSKEKRFVPAVLLGLEDHDPLVRIATANALKELGDRKAVPYLQTRLSREELPDVRGAIRRTIEQLNGYPLAE